MAIFTTPSQSTINKNLSTRIQSGLGTTYTASDSTYNIFSNAISQSIGDLKSEVISALNDMQVSSASGTALDSLGLSMYSLPRKIANRANTRGELSNVYFYCNSNKTFGEVNAGNDITIPAGTLISVIDDFDTREILYRTTEDKTLDKDSGREYVKVEAVSPGEFYNVETGSLIFHNFTNYSDSIYKELQVSNRYPIVNGADEESDELYRNRIINHLKTIGTNSADYYKYQSLRIPGVVDVRIIPSYYGIGTVGLLPITDGLTVSNSIMTNLRSNISSSKVLGQRLEFINPILVKINIDLTVIISNGLSSEKKSALESSIKGIIFKQLKNQEITTGRLNFNDFFTFLKDNLTRLAGVQVVKEDAISSISITKSARIDSSGEASESYMKSDSYSFDISEILNFGTISVTLQESN